MKRILYTHISKLFLALLLMLTTIPATFAQNDFDIFGADQTGQGIEISFQFKGIEKRSYDAILFVKKGANGQYIRLRNLGYVKPNVLIKELYTPEDTKQSEIYQFRIEITVEDKNYDMTKMVKIEEGELQTGCLDSELDCRAENDVINTLNINSFYASNTEVTLAEFKEFVSKTQYKTSADSLGGSYCFKNGQWKFVKNINWKNDYKGDPIPEKDYELFPVVHVSWKDAQAFCEWAKVRLLTEAEWEFVAGRELDANQLESNEWFSDNSSAMGAHPVKTKNKNELGLYDMYGNVWEWCDFVKSNDQNSNDPLLRVYKGGAWNSKSDALKRNNRFFNSPEFRSGAGGFRVGSN